MRPTTVWVRATGKEGSLRIYASYTDGAAGMDAVGREVLLASFDGPMTDRMLTVPLMEGLWDGVTIRLEMTGEWVIHDVIRRYEVVQS